MNTLNNCKKVPLLSPLGGMRLKNLIIGYKNKPLNIPSLPPRGELEGGFSASLHPGKLTCLVGRNGVGKSTLLRTLAGFQPSLGGEMMLGDHSLTDMDMRQKARHISVVLTGRPDLQQMSVREVVSMGRSPYTDMWGTLRPDDKAIVDACIAQVGINSLSERNVETLSDGECQKVMIAKAMAQQTPIILLDEPTAFLDYPSKAETMRLLKQIAIENNAALLLSTHDMEMAIHMADQFWVMTTDHQLITGTPAELDDVLTHEKLKTIF